MKDATPRDPGNVHDEVCGMTIAAKDAAASMVFQGTRYYFCSPRCRQKFEEHPGRYVPLAGETAGSESG